MPRIGDMLPDGGDQILFEFGEKQAKRPAQPTKDSWRSFKDRATCHVCTIDVSNNRQELARQPASTLLVRQGEEWLLCSVHREEIKTGKRELPGRAL